MTDATVEHHSQFNPFCNSSSPSSPCAPGPEQEDREGQVDDEIEKEENGQVKKKEKALTTLFNLPIRSPTSFSHFEPHPDPHPPPLYLPSPHDILPSHYTIPLSRKRCLIRALTSSQCTATTSTSMLKVGSKRPHASSSSLESEKKRLRLRWIDSDTLTKQACLRVACSASGLCSKVDMNDELRHDILQKVDEWSVIQLREYLTKAGYKVGAMPKHQLIHIVKSHLTPEG